MSTGDSPDTWTAVVIYSSNCACPSTISIARPPVVSVLVALYRESGIAARLVRRLGRLDWPRDRLDILLVVEDDDRATRAALDRPDLPDWMRVLVVPPGTLKTKPRALNYALDFCRGSIVGIYDAEDAPEPDQIRKVVARFHARPRAVACLQGVLAFYNPRTNRLSRCFTVDYAAWFQVMLPGLDRMGLPVPLGGTTVFFRREVLEEVGAWDAHNVTEDADLGVRLARRGYRTELIDSVTFEEANCHVIPWIRQRSRWLKGYMMTWAVHMRAPVLLWRQLGPRGFLGFQALFLGTIAQLLLAPLILSCWVAGLGAGHPLALVLPAWGMGLLVGTCLLAEAVTLFVNGLGLRRSGQPVGMGTLPLMHVYGPLAALAAWRGLWDLARRPFHWDKTAHGLHQPRPAPAARAGARAAPSAFRRTG
ncbi:MAG: glycosyltransferase [Rhodobacterales bacterium]|nr:glycosyltransferase [Rhodobacterales bacterium]